MWTEFSLLIGLLFVLVGAIGLVSPQRLLDWMNALDLPRLIFPIAAVRIIMGVTIGFAASDSLYPAALRVFAGFLILAGVAVPLIGGVRIQRMAQWWFRQPPVWMRAWGAIAIGLGVFLLYCLSGR